MTSKSRTVIERGDEMNGTTNSFPLVPLFVTTRDAVRLFSIGRTRLYELRQDHEGFRALTIKAVINGLKIIVVENWNKLWAMWCGAAREGGP